MINLSFSVPLSQDVLLDAAFHVLLEEDGSEFRTLCEEVVALKAKLRELEKYLFESLPGEGKEESYWNCTDKILSIVTSKNEVSKINVRATYLREFWDPIERLASFI